MKRPSFQFYPQDWLGDACLRGCSLQAQGLWIGMLCLMHQGYPYGHLKVGGKDIPRTYLARIFGLGEAELEVLLGELEGVGVFSRSKDGSIFSRRMVSDEKLRQVRAAGGVKSLNNLNVPRSKKDILKGIHSTKSAPSLGGSFGGSPSSSSSSSKNKPLQKSQLLTQQLTESLLETSAPSSQGLGGNGSKPGPRRVPNPKHTPVKEFALKAYAFLNPGQQCPWGPADAKQLDNLLKRNPAVPVEEFREWFRNYADSENINPAEPPFRYLPRLDGYRAGPLNQYGKPTKGIVK